MLVRKDAPAESLIVTGARVLDPVNGVDAQIDVRIDDGVIAQLGTSLERNGHRVIDGAGLVLAPAFVDPHVHLRVPGREDEETIASGTAAAAAGGFCAILAMPNTEPVVDSAAVLGALFEDARREAEVPVGFLAAITKGQAGGELTEMAELADAGAVAFSDDGRPVTAPGLMRRALQYGSVTGLKLALHCEEPTLSRGGHVHEGPVSAELGFGGYPSIAESVMVERDLSLAAYEERPLHLLHLSARESVAALRAARECGVEATAEVTPHHLCLTDEAVRTLDSNLKMNPPLRSREDRAALIDALRDGTISAIATDHAPHARHEKEVPFEAAPFGVTGLETAFSALYTHLVETGVLPLETILERMSAGAARTYGLTEPPIAVGARANLVLLDLNASWRVEEGGFRSRSKNSWLLGETLRGKVRATIADGRMVFEGMTGFLALEDGTIFRGESVAAEGFAFGEAVFTTAMTGYQEVVTDPSYAEQLVCFTAPMIGNYGVAEERSESKRPHARAVLMREARGPAWTDWLHERGIVALSGLDTRSLVLKLREGGAMRAAVISGDASLDEVQRAIDEQPPMAGRALVHDVSTHEPYVYSEHGLARVAVVDYGCKRSILRRLAGAGAAVTVFPHDVSADELATFDGVMLTNGPGDPEPLVEEVAVLRELLGRVPVLGICLGHQLLGLATGHETYKLRFGHRGANHPVLERATGKVLVTSQNHGFAVAPSDDKEATHVSLYDGTVEGFEFSDLRARSVQFHPEAGPGPHDAWPIISEWIEELSTVAA